MTQRKPPGISFETWVDRQVREATDRGEFDNLPGWGKPIADLDRPRDELWWVRQKMRNENLSYLPPTLALRKEAEDALAAVTHAGSEAEVRRIVAAVNEKIRAANRVPPPGPPLNLAPFDVEAIVDDWKASRVGEAGERHEPAQGTSAEADAQGHAPPGERPATATRAPRNRWRWWRWRRPRTD